MYKHPDVNMLFTYTCKKISESIHKKLNKIVIKLISIMYCMPVFP